MNKLGLVLVLVLFSGSWGLAREYTFQVRHDHDPWGECLGEMTVADSGISFVSEEEEHSVDWMWTDIQAFDRRSESEFSLLSYKDRKWLAGKDRVFNFTVEEGAGFSEEVFSLVEENLPVPYVNRIPVVEEGPVYEIPVKHLHLFGGCEGILRFGRELIVFESGNGEDSRSWRKETEIAGVWSSGPWDLDILAREVSAGGSTRERRFSFRLKEPLNEEFFFKLRRELLP